MNLYLASIDLSVYKYMGDTTYRTVVRLVEAESPGEAEAKIKAHYETGDPYGTSVKVTDIDLTEPIR